MIQFEVPGIPPSWNQIMRMHRMEQVRVANEWHATIGWAALAAKVETRHIPRARVTLRYRFPDRRRRDPDNYAGKFLLDGLTQTGIIADDSFDVITLVIERGEPVKGGAVEIEIEEAER